MFKTRYSGKDLHFAPPEYVHWVYDCNSNSALNANDVQ